MKKLLSLVLCGAMAVSVTALTGCSKDYPTEKGATSIMFYAQDFEDWSNEHLYEKVKEFNSNLNDGIQIEMRMYEDSEYTQALTSAREGGYAPDIYMVSYGNLAGDIQKKYPAVVNDLLPQSAFDDLLDNVEEMVCYDGTYYGYPQLTEPSSLLFYRKSALKKANVVSDPATWDWSDLYGACEAIKPTLGKMQYVIGLPTALPAGWATVGLQYDTAGYLPLNDNWDTCMVTPTIETSTQNYKSENGYANLARLWYDLYSAGYVPLSNVSPTGYNDIIEGLCDGKLAMTFAGSWSVAEILNTYPDIADDIGVAPVPTIDGDKSGATATNGGWVYSISDSSTQEKKEKAAAFIKWLLIEDTARTASYFERAHYSKAPVTKGVQDYIKEHADEEYTEWRDVINDVAAKALSEPLYSFDVTLRYAAVLEDIVINARPIGDGHTNEDIDGEISALLAKMVSEINMDIDRNHLAGTNPKPKN